MKKIISILLALVTASSLFAVSASARVLGDVNSDGKVNSNDALQILLYAVGSASSLNPAYADVDGNGTINSADALKALMISVGNYDGPTEVDLKPEIINPIVTSGKYTLSVNVIEKDDSGTVSEMPVTMMVNGNDICIATTITYEGTTLNARLLIADGKAKIVLPDYYLTVIIPEEYLDGMDLGSIDFGSLDFSGDQTYVSSRFVTEKGKKYTVDSYKDAYGSITDYYFLNGKWAKSCNVDSKGNIISSREVTEFKKGVTSKYFSTLGTVEITLQELMDFIESMS